MGETQKTKPSNKALESADAVAADILRADLKDPHVVLSLLEADQVVAAKTQTHFERRELSRGVRLLLWGLRIYVVIMMVIVIISVFRAFHGPH